MIGNVFFPPFAKFTFHTFTVINGTHPTLRADPYSPGAVLRALNALGWVIPPDEHDAHELLHVMLSSLEEEAIRPKKVGHNVCPNFGTIMRFVIL